ncbi:MULTISPECIES: RNA polymerase sigma factor [unclassified Sphingobacterium]|uniref:RNA polymerase sigma factor n=1 Tax=unclassified Sphingobacterium TaxID=2609468 RepID=UPI0025DA547D|nr:MULTISPECIES: RNA polymerase sigma factor [unclassified Sphingobacterium]
MSWIGFIQGNRSSFEEIYDTYIDDLYSYGKQYHYDKDTVLDCIHDLFVHLFDNPKIAKDVQVKYYLFAALRRKLLRLKVETVAIDSLSEDVYWTNSHELELINDEVEAGVVKVIKEKVDALPKRQREVLFLRYYLDFSYDEIAQMMGVNVETCRTLTFRAIKQLKVELKPIELFTIFYIFFNRF